MARTEILSQTYISCIIALNINGSASKLNSRDHTGLKTETKTRLKHEISIDIFIAF